MTDNFRFSPLGRDIKDTDWVQQALFVPEYRLNATTGRSGRSTRTGASGKFYDTTPGGNRVMNPCPQFTRTADIKNYGVGGGSHGMGRYYSEAIDDNIHQVTMSFGVPEFNSLSNFLGTFHNPYMATLVNRGEAGTMAYGAGYALGFITSLPLQAFYGIVSLVSRINAVATGNPYSKFYYMKSTMGLYWNAVTTIYNDIAASMGIIPAATKNSEGEVDDLAKEDIELANRYLPDVIRENNDGNVGGINIFALSTRAQRLANAQRSALHKIGERASNSGVNFVDAVGEEMSRLNTANPETPDTGKPYGEYMRAMTSEDGYKPKQATMSMVTNSAGEEKEVSTVPLKIEEPGFWEYLKSEISEGSRFISFSVEPTTYSESFTNSTKTSVIAEKLRGANSAARDVNFSMAEGNIVGDTVKSITDAIKDFTTGALDSVGLGGIGAVLGDAYVEIPKVWDESSAELGEHSYKIRLQPPYANPLSLAYHVYPVVAMLLAGALPRSTGKHAYSSPFLCSLFSQGRTNIKLGMIKSLNISRGVSNIGWTADNLPGAVEIDFTVVNLDEIIHIPIAESLGITNALSHFDEESALSDYLSTLGSLGLYSRFYASERFAVAWRKTTMNFDTFTSSAAVAQALGDSAIGGIAKIFAAAGELD